MKQISFEEMVERLGIRMDNINKNYKHYYRCWQCRDTGVVPYNNNEGIYWKPAKTHDEVYWVLCNKCDFHKKVSEKS